MQTNTGPAGSLMGILASVGVILWPVPILLAFSIPFLVGAVGQSVLLPGDQPVRLEYGTHELGYRGYVRSCTSELQQRPLPTAVTVTRLSDGAVVSLEPIANPAGFCNHGTWTGPIYRFEVAQPGLYQVGGQPPAEPSVQAAGAMPALVILPDPILTVLVKAANLAPRLFFLAVVCLLPAVLTALAARLRAARRPAELAPRS
jgi:hypothetical protein